MMNKKIEIFIKSKNCNSDWDFICHGLYLKDFNLIVNYFEEDDLYKKQIIGKRLKKDGFKFYTNYNNMELECTRINQSGMQCIPFEINQNNQLNFQWEKVYYKDII